MLPTRFEIQRDGGVIRESGEGTLGGVENGFKLLVDGLYLCLLIRRQSGIDVDVEVRVRDGADGFGGVVGGPLLKVFLRQAAFERRGGSEDNRRVVRAQR